MRLRPRRPLVAGFIGLLVTWPIFLVTLSITTVTAVITAAACGAGFALSLFGTLWATVLQRHVPRDVLSRVSAYDWLGSKAMSPVGVVLAGFLGSSMNVSAMLLFIAAWCGLSTVCSLVFGGGARLISSPLPAPYQQTA